MSRFHLSAAAERDLDQIKTYLAQNAGSKTARRLLREILAAARFLAANPEAVHTREDLTEMSVKFWAVYSYVIVYQHRTRPVRVLRVLRDNRDVEGLLGRG